MSNFSGAPKANLIAARGAAFRLHRDLGFPHPRAVQIEDLAMYRKVFVKEGPLKSAEGRLIRKKGRGIVHIRNSFKFEGRRQFTIAHELGHWELHKGVSQFLCEESDMRDYGHSPMEMEANCFAAELLMPTGHFRDAYGKAYPSFSLIESLAEEFNTTLTATAIRLADTSKFRIIIVWFQKGIIRWSYSNPDHNLPFLVKNRPLPRYSSATLDPSDISDELTLYEDSNWFPDIDWRRDQVLEVTKKMPNLDAGLTILYFP